MAADWSPEIWDSWEKSGKLEFLKIFKSYIKDADRSPLLSKSGKLTGISRALYELFVKGVRGNLRKEAVVSMLSELAGLHADLPSIILDVACIIDSETCSETATEERSKFCFIVRETEKFLSDKLLKERLEIDTLQDVGTLKNKNFYTKFIKIKTKLYYKQRKFNLFREESEGYAKLIVELNQEISGKIDAKSILEIIKSLIGCFNLDPNRVLDIILESFESRPEHEEFFIPLVKSYMGDPRIICEVLGFKFASHADDSLGVPDGLYTITALLLQHSIFTLDDIYQWLKPNDSVIWKECEREMKDAQEYVRKLSIICTNKQPGDEEKEIKESPQERAVVVDHSNQKLQLGAALLAVGCWSGFSALAARLPDYRASSYPPAAKALCRLLHATIDPLYKQYCPIAPKIKSKPVQPLSNKLAVPRAQKLEDLRDVVVPALAILGPALHTDPVLMYKVVRLCRSSRSAPGDPLRLEVLSILDSAVLPALSYMDCNCCMAEEVYSLLKLYSYQFRYCLYARWKNEAPLRHANLLRRRADAQRQIKAIMKRVSKENVKPQGRLIGKLSHAAPAFFFDYVLLQIQIYDNLIGPVVESLKYLTSLSYDMLGYCLVEALGGGKRARVQPDGSSAAPWLQGLAAFCGAACKKYAIDLTALLQFVVNQLKAQKSLDLLILKEIVQKMAGIEAAEEMTAEQLDAMSGGELLRGEAGYFCQVRNTKKSSQRLKEALVSGGEGLDAALCLLAAQQRHCCVYQAGGAEGAPRPHLKLVGRLIDQCQDALVQFGAFLATTHTHDEYSSRLPPIEAMLQEYHIGADVAFFLARPALAWSIGSRYEKLRHERSSPATSKQHRYAEAAAAAMAPIVTAVSTTLPSKVWEDISPEFYVTFWSLTMYDLNVPYESYEREMERLKGLAAAAGAESGANAAKGRKEQERYLTLENKLKEECRKQQEYVDRVMYRLKQEKDSWFPSRSVKSAKNETITQFMQLCLFPRCIFTTMDALYCAHFLHTIHSLKTANFSTLLCYDRLFCDITYTVTCLTEGEAARYGRFLGAVLSTAMRWHGERAAFQRECANSPGFVTKFRVSNQFTEANDHVGYENYSCLGLGCNHIRGVCIRKTCQKTPQELCQMVLWAYYEPKKKFELFYYLVGRPPRTAEKAIKPFAYGRCIGAALHVCHKWHYKITKAMVVCLDSRDYVQIRNSLIVLIRILPHFPVLAKLSQIIERKIEKVREEEKNQRQDLYILATSYSGQLRSRAPNMMREADFHQVPAGGAPPPMATPSAVPSTPANGDQRNDKEVKKDLSSKERKSNNKVEDGSNRESKRDSSQPSRSSGTGVERRSGPTGGGSEWEERRVATGKGTTEARGGRGEEDRRSNKDRTPTERTYRDEARYLEAVSPPGAGGGGGLDRSGGGEEMSSLSSTNSNGSHRAAHSLDSQERDMKRRKLDENSTMKNKDTREGSPPERRTRSVKGAGAGGPGSLPAGGRGTRGTEEREARKERKLGRKRDRADEALLEQKRRREEQKGHQNGDQDEHHIEKHHHKREKSPYRDRSHERQETRDKQRTNDGKLRR